MIHSPLMVMVASIDLGLSQSFFAFPAPQMEGGGSGSISLLLLFFAIAIGVSFFCSLLEAVFLSITPTFVADLKNKKPKIGSELERLKARLDRPLTSILTLNTAAHTMGTMGVAAQVAGLTNNGWIETAVGAIMTLAILILSEIIPKSLGARYWKSWAPWVTATLKQLTMLMTPFLAFISLFNKGGHVQDSFSRDELHVMAEIGHQEGKLHADEKRILNNLLRLREIAVSDVMTPRVVVFTLLDQTTLQDFVQNHAHTPFSRIPIHGGNPDKIAGFVLKNDLLLAVAKKQEEKCLADFQREIAAMSEYTPLQEAFRQFIENRDQIAMVYDEFGGVSGLVTMEDIVETLLGLEIVDELDTKEDMQEFARELWNARARQAGIELPPSN